MYFAELLKEILQFCLFLRAEALYFQRAFKPVAVQMDDRLQPQLSPKTHIRVGTNAFVFILKLVVKVLENLFDGNLILRFKYGSAEGQGSPKNLC